MAQVYIVKNDCLPPTTWGIYRVGTGPGRGEALGFTMVAEARRWAKVHGHEVVTLTMKTEAKKTRTSRSQK
ncbi:MAG: hypothetical protein KGZ65_04430 [Sphingomonadales bacterium]|nr:hypothetical protein [Sphingomonadaceae bacterium]MBS3930461.1 hypothetical protein [Sphingomonadales bacterium]